MKEIGFDVMLERCMNTQSEILMGNETAPMSDGWVGFEDGSAAEYEYDGKEFTRKRIL